MSFQYNDGLFANVYLYCCTFAYMHKTDSSLSCNRIQTEGDVINKYEIQTVQLILDSGITHYKDIEKSTGKSRKTVNKYLNNIAEEVKKFQVRLVRKRNVGIYFEGDTSALRTSFYGRGVLAEQESEQKVMLSLISDLLTLDQPITIQELCEEHFVSRTTLEKYLKEIRGFIEQKGAALESDHNGLFIKAPESVKRQLMSEVLQNYWGGGDQQIENEQDNRLTVSVPPELRCLFDQKVFEKVENTLDQFQEKSNVKLNDFEFQSLAVHLVIAIQRIKKGEVLKSDAYLAEQRFSDNTKVLCDLLECNFNTTIPYDEQQYINIHILAAETSEKQNGSDLVDETKKSSQNDNAIGNFLRNTLNDYDETLIDNLTLHLIPALRRFSLGLTIKNPYTRDVKKFFPFAYNKAIDLTIQIERKFSVHINDDEVAYIALHVEAYNERKNEKLTAVIACSTGLGTARLLEQRINKYFSDSITVKRIISVSELKQQNISEDLIISTVGANVSGKKVIVVPPFLDNKSKDKIQYAIDEYKGTGSTENAFMNLIHPELITIDPGQSTKNQAIKSISQQLQNEGYASSGIYEAAIKREKLASTQIDFVAMPHAPVDFVKQPCISVYINTQGIEGSQGKVNIVFFLAMDQTIKDSIDDIYGYFNDLLEDKQLLQKISRATTKDEVIKMLGSERVVE